MNFGEKFPYALLTFSQSLSKLIVGHTFSQSLSKLIVGHTFSQKFVEAGYWVHLTPKTCQAACSTHAHLLPKVCRSWLLGTLHPNHYPHANTPTSHSKAPSTHSTIPTIPPIPTLLRVDSDEMRQNRQVLGS